MELFFCPDPADGFCRLDEEESAHCVRVLRHREGDMLDIIDGCGSLYHCRLEDASPKKAAARILSEEKDWGGHPYRLTLAVCPTKNNERYEWFVEKAVETGVDVIAPVIGERSERKVYKTQRALKIALSATKQSLKARLPEILEPVSVKDFIASCRSGLRMIACCFEDEAHPRRSIRKVLEEWTGEPEYTVLIGPEGDFSPAELAAAIEGGFVPVHLGNSRLRTETAALTAAQAAYFKHMD
ncbi:MAG: 16S rRNA (uracil(1498)-N(3))-methyltransferase [Bacteroidales bacterium]|nr:16S rRNA (uracil(1498)-N(3))-methyltransferase [Bacteroidales bacterium]